MTSERIELVERVAADHPERFYRVRMACRWSSSEIDADKHAAVIVRDAVDALSSDRLPYGRVAREKRKAAA